MDYIQEELLRQKRILSALMTGGQREGAEDTAAEENVTASDWQAAAGREKRIGLEQMETESAQRLHNRSGASGSSAAERGMSGRSDSRMWERSMSAVSVTEATDVPVRMVPYERTVPAVPAGVREVSRSIQRDARRYDGGFSIY